MIKKKNSIQEYLNDKNFYNKMYYFKQKNSSELKNFTSKILNKSLYTRLEKNLNFII